MSTEAGTIQNTSTEVIEVQGNKLIRTLKSILASGKINRIIISSANGATLLDIPYAAGLTATALVTLLIHPLALLTPIVLLLGRFKIEIVRLEGEQAPTWQEAAREPEAPPTSEEAAREPEAEAPPTSEEAAREPEAEVEVEIEPATPADKPEPDKLEKITGIGKVFAGRLRNAGIHTFAQLAEQSPERISEIVSEEKKVSISETQEWINQARQLAGKDEA